MLRLPQTAEYALRAVLHVAAAPLGRPVRAAQIARALRLPRNYLSKTLHQLARAGVLRSTRGPSGGFQLATPAERLALADVVAPFLPVAGRVCVLGRARCGDTAPCAAHARWAVAAGPMRAFFDGTTVHDLVSGTGHRPPSERREAGSASGGARRPVAGQRKRVRKGEA